MLKKNLKSSALVILGAYFLLGVGLQNRFPIFFDPSFHWLSTAFGGKWQQEGLYALFVKQASFGHTLWYVIYIQALLSSILFWEATKLFSKKEHHTFYYLILIFCLVWSTSISWVVSSFLPQIFSFLAVGFLSLVLLTNLPSWKRAVFSGLFLMSVWMKPSFSIQSGMVFMTFGIFYFFLSRKPGWNCFSKQRLLFLSGLIGFSIFIGGATFGTKVFTGLFQNPLILLKSSVLLDVEPYEDPLKAQFVEQVLPMDRNDFLNSEQHSDKLFYVDFWQLRKRHILSFCMAFGIFPGVLIFRRLRSSLKSQQVYFLLLMGVWTFLNAFFFQDLPSLMWFGYTLPLGCVLSIFSTGFLNRFL